MSDRYLMWVFIAAGAGIPFLAAVMLLPAALRRRRGLRVRHSRPYLWLRRLVVLSAGVLAVCAGWAYFVEPYRLEVTHVSLTLPRLAGASRPLRIVQISDLHCDRKVRLEDRLPAVVAAERPDLIVFTGDAINSPAGLGNFKRCLSALAKIAPTYAVKGNWDMKYYAEDIFGGTGAVELDGQTAVVSVDGIDLRLVGAAFWRENLLEPALNKAGSPAPTVVLCHNPDAVVPLAGRTDVDLCLSGHTHGGQVAVPFYGALVTFSRYGKRFERGLYRLENTWLYVNRGIGMEGGAAPRLRFCSTPEVTVFELSPPPAPAPN